jgi:hypothetical protein
MCLSVRMNYKSEANIVKDFPCHTLKVALHKVIVTSNWQNLYKKKKKKCEAQCYTKSFKGVQYKATKYASKFFFST